MYKRRFDGMPLTIDTNLPAIEIYNRCGFIPAPRKNKFQNKYYSYEVPVIIFGWQYSFDFGQWSALVQFDHDPVAVWTYPLL